MRNEFGDVHDPINSFAKSDEESNEDKAKLASLPKNSLVFMLVVFNLSWKVPFGYFLIDTCNDR